MNNRLFKKDDDKKLRENRELALENGDVIRKQIKGLMKIGQRNFAHYQINRDPIRGKIPEGMIEEIIVKSIECGKEEAEKLRNKYGDLPIQDIAKNLGLKVEYRDRQDAMDFVYFGLFETPNNIIIYEGNIGEATSLLKELRIDYFKVDFRDIVLAHEIFHFIEENDKDLYTNSFKIDLWSLGKLYTHRSRLLSTGEIAGMSFSKTLLNLDFDPNILDYIFLAAFDFEKANKLFESMMKYNRV